MTQKRSFSLLYMGMFLAVIIILPVSVYTIGLDVIHKRHIQFTTDNNYVEKLSCQDLVGNFTELKSVQLYDVKQLQDDILQLEKEKSCQ